MAEFRLDIEARWDEPAFTRRDLVAQYEQVEKAKVRRERTGRRAWVEITVDEWGRERHAHFHDGRLVSVSHVEPRGAQESKPWARAAAPGRKLA